MSVKGNADDDTRPFSIKSHEDKAQIGYAELQTVSRLARHFEGRDPSRGAIDIEMGQAS